MSYKKKPALILFFSLVYLLNPIVNFILMFLNNNSHTPAEHVNAILSLLTGGDFITILSVFLWISAIPLAFGLFYVEKWSWYYFIIHSSLTIGNSLLLKSNSGYYIYLNPYFLLNIFILIPAGFFIKKEIRSPYLNPSLKWWKQAKRIRHNVKIFIKDREYQTFDISETGAFVLTSKDQLTPDIDDIVPTEIALDNESLKCYSKVIWNNSENENEKPHGLGIKFLRLYKTDKKILSSFIKTLINEGVKR